MNQLPDKNKDKLNKLIKSNQLEKPSADFTLNVMNKLGIQYNTETVKASPIISKNGWLFIGLIVITIVSLAFLEPNNTQSTITGSVINSVESTMGSILKSSVMMYLAMITFSIFLLTGADALFRNSRLKMMQS